MAETRVGIIIEGQDKFSNVLNKVEGNLGGFRGKLEGLAPAFTKMAAVGTVAFGAISAGVFKSIEASREAAEVQAQLGAVLKSTGGIAGVTAEKANELAKALQKQTTFGDEAILSAENMLLTFTNIKADVFPDAIKTVLDMSVALGQDLKSSAIQVGKALNDPILGVTALRRVGVNFTESQQEMIAKLVESGKVMEAQKFILAELATEFGGSASAQAETFSGKIKQMQERFGDLQEAVGNAFIPVLERLTEKLAPTIERFVEWAEKNPDLIVKLTMVAAAVSALIAVLGFLGLIVPKVIIGIELLGKAMIFMHASIIPKLVAGVGLVRTAMTALMASVNPATAVVVALGVAIIAVIDSFQRLKAEMAGLRASGDALDEQNKKLQALIDKKKQLGQDTTKLEEMIKGNEESIQDSRRSTFSRFTEGLGDTFGVNRDRAAAPVPVETSQPSINYTFNGDILSPDELMRKLNEFNSKTYNLKTVQP